MFTRSSGVQLHPTSLPGGTLGREAYRFVDWLADAGQTWWQMLPLGPPDRYRSPYKSKSAFASWPGLLAKWWLGDAESGTYGGVYLFASREDADRSRETELFRGMATNPALQQVTVREYDLLDAPTGLTAPALPQAG